MLDLEMLEMARKLEMAIKDVDSENIAKTLPLRAVPNLVERVYGRVVTSRTSLSDAAQFYSSSDRVGI